MTSEQYRGSPATVDVFGIRTIVCARSAEAWRDIRCRAPRCSIEGRKAMRLCPTLPGDDRPLIAHTIVNGVCMERQREFYHKCHRCLYRGKPADFAVEPVHRNGAVVEPEPIDVDVDAEIESTAERS